MHGWLAMARVRSFITYNPVLFLRPLGFFNEVGWSEKLTFFFSGVVV